MNRGRLAVVGVFLAISLGTGSLTYAQQTEQSRTAPPAQVEQPNRQQELFRQGLPANSSGAGSPMNSFMARAVGMIVIDLVLVVFLLMTGMLIVNFGLLSKRQEDRQLGHREPSDVAILESELWGVESTADEEHRERPDWAA